MSQQFGLYDRVLVAIKFSKLFTGVKLPTGTFLQDRTYRKMKQQASYGRKRAKESKKWPRILPKDSSNEVEQILVLPEKLAKELIIS